MLPCLSRRSVLPMATAFFALALACARAPVERELWLWSSANLADSASVERTEALWRRAADAGYSTVVLSDPKFSRLASQDAAYFARLASLRALADELKLELVPALFPVGRAQGAALEQNPDLAEALPVRGALFEVRHGVARLVPDPPVALAARPDRVQGEARVDGGVFRIESPRKAVRARWRVKVAPWRCYHLAVDLRTRDFEGEPSIKVRSGGREIAFAAPRAKPVQDWAPFDVAFVSQAESELEVVIGAAEARKGTLEYRGWSLEEAGPVNVVRRASTPFEAEGLAEGRDFEFVRDPLMGASPWRGQFDRWHEPPPIRVHRPDGTRFRASWWSAALVLRGQAALCLADTLAKAQLADEARRVREAFGARTYLMLHDEIRALGGDPACRESGATPGRILADDARYCRGLLAPARVCAWNDMFDPFQNAVRDPYLVHGDFAGSWEGLDSSVVILNWNTPRLSESLAFFARRGHRQVYAGYYDGRVEELRDVLALLDRTPRVTGIMYTTWQDRYDDLETFARIARGGR